MLRLFVNKNIIKFNLLLIIFNYLIPSNFNKYFNGLPLIDTFHLLFLFIILPFILLNLEFLKSIIIKYLIVTITIIKIFLFLAPENGISHKMYFDTNKDQNFIKTYSTFWNKKYSAVQKSDWKKKENFPIDWLPSTDIILDSSNPYYYYTKEDFTNIDLVFETEFLISIYEDSKLKLNLPNKNFFKITIKDINSKKNLKIKNNNINLQKGLYLIKLKHTQLGNNYQFAPSVVSKKTKNELNILAKNLAFLPNEKISHNKIFISNLFANLYDFLIIIFLVFILLKLILKFLKKKRLIKNVLFIFSFTIILSFLISLLIQNEKILLYKLNLAYSLSLILYLSLFLINRLEIFKKPFFFKKIEFDNFDYLFCFMLPLIIIGFLRFSNEIGGLSWWIPGDDGHTFQIFAREIVVDGEWLHPNIMYRQAPMYLYSLFHIIFGQSSFAQKIIEYYLVVLICFFTLKIIFNITLNKNLALIMSLILMIIFTGEKYTTFIGKGYTEYYAAFLIIFTIYLLRKRNLNLPMFIILFLFSFIGLGLREDHIFVIFTIIFYSLSLKKSNKENLYFSTYEIIKKNFFKISSYGLLIIFSFLLLYLRNYYAAPDALEKIAQHQNLLLFSDLFNHPSLSSKNNLETAYLNETIFHSYYRMFFGSAPFEIPRLTTLFLLTGFLLCLYSLIHPNKKNFVSIGTLLSILGILFPYIFLVNHGYEPRYTIHYLPFCMIIISEYINKYFRNSRVFQKF
jgi:hypothetical protein